MGVLLYDVTNSTKKLLDRHAVAIVGYKLGKADIIPHGASDFRLIASRVDKIYVHDDQLGPFARMTFEGTKNLPFGGTEQDLLTLSTDLKFPERNIKTVVAAPELVLVPLYHKIRIPFEIVHDTVIYFDSFIDLLGTRGMLPGSISQRLEWDIYLTNVTDFKREIFVDKYLPEDYRREVLTESMPRFLWRATAFCGENIVIDLIFDATDIEQGSYFVRAIEYDQDFSNMLREAVKEQSVVDYFETRYEWKILGWFKITNLP
jgi:hypothetical protein